MRTEDGYIIHECLNERPEAFGILVDKYKAGIYAYVYAELRNFQDAQDVTQEVFLQAYRGLRNLRRWESFASWLYRIARNLSRKWIRAESRRPDRKFIEDQNPEALENISIDSYRESQMNESLQEALHLLPENYREALMLYYFGGMSSVDMARALGISPTAVRHRLSRARARLKQEMVTMMDTAFEGQRLQSSFTFRVVETIKRIKIDPMPRMAGVPWGLSLAMGMIITVLSLNPQISMPGDMVSPSSSSLSTEMRVLKNGEIPVDILKISQTPVIANSQDDSSDGAAELTTPQYALLMAPQAEKGEWTPGPEMPNARYGVSACEVKGKIYVIGGIKVWLKTLSIVEEYDPATDTWKRKADMPTARVGHSISVVNDKIYVIGGMNATLSPLSTIEEYDPETDTWKKKRDMPTPRANFSTSATNGRIYAIGGWQPGTQLSTVEEYNPLTDIWAKRSSIPSPRDGLSTSVVNGRIYAIGGVIGFGQAAKLLSVVEEYDPKTDTWTKKSSMLTPRATISTCAMENRIYAVGGLTDKVSVTSTLEVYNPMTDTWAQGANMLTPRVGCSIIAFNDHLYVFGGSQKAFGPAQPGVPAIPSVEMYKPGSQSEDVEPKGKLVTPWGKIKLRYP
ncbi:sigma-70 family RNA polymerase sigma factor [Candidatus Poribacteria bacterium]